MKKLLSALTILIFTVVLYACSVEEIDDKTEYEKVSVTHTVSKFERMDGEKAVYKRMDVTEDFYVSPKKVFLYSWAIADIIDYFGLDEMGIEVLGLPTDSANIPNLISGLKNTTHHSIGTLQVINFDIIDLVRPDLIILDGRTSSYYEEIKEKFPNINVLDASSSTYSLDTQKKVFNNIGKIFPAIKDELLVKLNEFETKFNEIAEISKEYRTSFIMLNGNTFSYHNGKNSRYGVIFNEFGFVEADPNGDTYESGSHGNEFNKEYLVEINPDVIFLMDRNIIVNGQESDKTFFNEPLLKGLNAVKNNRIYNLNAEAWYTVTGGIKATEQMINDVTAFINDLK